MLIIFHFLLPHFIIVFFFSYIVPGVLVCSPLRLSAAPVHHFPPIVFVPPSDPSWFDIGHSLCHPPFKGARSIVQLSGRCEEWVSSSSCLFFWFRLLCFTQKNLSRFCKFPSSPLPSLRPTINPPLACECPPPLLLLKVAPASSFSSYQAAPLPDAKRLPH